MNKYCVYTKNFSTSSLFTTNKSDVCDAWRKMGFIVRLNPRWVKFTLSRIRLNLNQT